MQVPACLYLAMGSSWPLVYALHPQAQNILHA